MISAKLDAVGYSILISKDAMNFIPQYAGKVSVYIVLSGLKGVPEVASQAPEGEGETLPSADLPGVPLSIEYQK